MVARTVEGQESWRGEGYVERQELWEEEELLQKARNHGRGGARSRRRQKARKVEGTEVKRYKDELLILGLSLSW